MSKFKDGDPVYIADGSEYYSQGIRDGVKIRGIVKGEEGRDGWYYVKWEDGDTNSYKDEDLIHASDGKPQSETRVSNEPETEVYFTIDGVTYVYQLESTYYNYHAGDNNTIFELLGVNKYEFCSKAYGYEANGGDWPTWRYGDKEAPIKIVKAIREAIANKSATETVQPDYDSILAEARRRYPAGTMYRALYSNGMERGGTETSSGDCQWINGHGGGKMGIDCGIGYVYILKTDTWAEVVEQVATKEPKEPELLDLLAEARRRYPVGTRYACANTPECTYMVTEQNFSMPESGTVWGQSTKGVLYKNGKWAEVVGTTGTVSAGTDSVLVGTTNPDLRVSSITATYSNPYGTAPAGILYDSTTPQYITVSGTIDLNSMARKTLPDMQDPIIVKRNKQRTKLTVL